MAFSVNPLQFKTDKLDTDPQRKSFLGRLGDLLNQISISLLSPSFLAGVLNANAQLFNSALIFKSVSFGAVGTNQSVECANASVVSVTIGLTAAVTLTLNHLSLGVPVILTATNSSGASQNFTVLANNPASVSISVNHVPTSTPTGAGGFSAIGLSNLGTYCWTGSAVGTILYLFGS